MVDHYEDAGSPPRAWGAPHPQPADLGEPRLTPTGVGSTGWKAAGTTTTPAHPHGRGEHRAMPPETSRCRGSPPRAWGARSRPRSTGAPEEAHPHGRGEHTATSRSPTEPIGSPPRAWGAHDLRVAIGVERRLTPTGVGSTSASWWHPSTAPAHPHGRGEHSTSTAIGARDSGSPPRAWGAQAQLGGSEQEPRLTPTGVGSTGHRAGPAIAPSAHPHGRGEHCRRTVRVSTVHGSPPRAWGARAAGVPVVPLLRLTPTGVGSTPTRRMCGSPRTAHPHGRGEHSRSRSRTGITCGSPPRAWGAQPVQRAAVALPRLTPTGVGSTTSSTPLRMSSSAHPHGRGEHIADGIGWNPDDGSPPRAWGAHFSSTGSTGVGTS